jgi:predicted transcriptional regulator
MINEAEMKGSIRDEILEYICDSPGASYNAIKKAFRMKDGTLRYHLDHLLKNEKIKRTEKGERRYYPSERSDLRKVEGLSREHNRILLLIRKNPSVSLSRLKKFTGLGREDLYYALKKLRSRKLIIKTRTGKDPCYEYVEDSDFEREIMRIVADQYAKGEIDRKTYEKMRVRIKEKLGLD